MTMLDAIGSTPLLRLEGLLVKLECSNPGGSIKDRVARFMVQEALRRGELKDGDTLVEATSGNTGIALAMVGRELGHPVLIFMPEHMSPERRDLLERLGATLQLTPRELGFEEPIRRRDAYRGQPGFYVPDQFANPDNARCHETTTGAELLTQLRELGCERLDAFVAGVGTGGTLMGVGRALRAVFPRLLRVAVEPEESSVLSGGPAGEHEIQGIGDGFVPELVRMDEVDEVARVSSGAARATAMRIRREHGYCVGMSSGANTAAALELAVRGLSVATVWPDCSDRYVSRGLPGPAGDELRCPLHGRCESRRRAILG
ncbi:MAG TPA: cysteine synthase family protein [Planctomycetota bacterium]|nr:cysteine synthase family protein [Planctomycetota bacterium]